MQRCVDAKMQSLLRNILISPLEGEKKFFSELCELRNFREGYNLKYSCRNGNSDLPKQLWCIPLNKFLILGRKFNLFSETVFSRFTSHFSLNRKVAFTLAEVLITLGVIGIVAAMTLPSLINEYKKKEVETRLAHTYSTMTQAFKLAEADNGESQYWTKNIAGSSNISDMSIVDDFLTAYFIPYLNFNTKIETIDGYGLKNFGYDIRYFNGYQMNEMRITRLNNGVILFWGMFIGRQGICALHIVLDINGTKGPNRIGSDLFDMTYSLYDGELFMSGEKNIDGYELTYSKKQNYQQLLDNCKRTTTPDYFAPNYSCGAVIKLNGWKIPKDYPIKL